MKAEIGYPDAVMGDFIQDLIGDIEHNMQLAPPNDQYFEELSIQKFTLQQLLREIGRHEGDSPTAVVARFVGGDVCHGKRGRPTVRLFYLQGRGPVHPGRIIF